MLTKYGRLKTLYVFWRVIKQTLPFHLILLTVVINPKPFWLSLPSSSCHLPTLNSNYCLYQKAVNLKLSSWSCFKNQWGFIKILRHINMCLYINTYTYINPLLKNYIPLYPRLGSANNPLGPSSTVFTWKHKTTDFRTVLANLEVLILSFYRCSNWC